MASRARSKAPALCAALALSLLLPAQPAIAAPIPPASGAGVEALPGVTGVGAPVLPAALGALAPVGAAAGSLAVADAAAPTAVAPFEAATAEKPSDLAILATAQALCEQREAERAAAAAARRTDRTLPYDPALIAAIGNQADGGHSVCCPGYACAYGDAVLLGQVTDHAAYGCGCCTWPGWGGGDSSFRSLGSDAALLREAYDEIAAGRPTVVHVAGPYGEHWICLIGYRDAQDPDALTLDNFVALDPANGQEVVASYRYVPYGDHREHVSDAR